MRFSFLVAAFGMAGANDGFVRGDSVTFHESVREADVYIVATASSEETGTNGALMECVTFFFPPTLERRPWS